MFFQAKLDKVVIGHGSFGTVIKAKLRQYRNEFVLDDATGESKITKVVSDVDVAVKILTRSQTAMISGKYMYSYFLKSVVQINIIVLTFYCLIKTKNFKKFVKKRLMRFIILYLNTFVILARCD